MPVIFTRICLPTHFCSQRALTFHFVFMQHMLTKFRSMGENQFRDSPVLSGNGTLPYIDTEYPLRLLSAEQSDHDPPEHLHYFTYNCLHATRSLSFILPYGHAAEAPTRLARLSVNGSGRRLMLPYFKHSSLQEIPASN